MNKSQSISSRVEAFTELDAAGIAQLVAHSADFVVILDGQLRVQMIHFGELCGISDVASAWVGHPFSETLTIESQSKFKALIDGARSRDLPRWRQVNHATNDDDDLPVSYAAHLLEDQSILLLGRDKQELSALQQRLVHAQLTIEQDYERIRQVESRYRVLFETGTDAFLIITADTGRVVDANSVAARMLAPEAGDILNRRFDRWIDPASVSEFEATLSDVRTKGGQKSSKIVLRNASAPVWLDALLFRSVSDTLVLCRIRRQSHASEEHHPFPDALLEFFEGTGDAVVFTDKEGTILRSNPAFQMLTNVAVAEQLSGANLGDYLGRPAVDLNVMASNAEKAGRLSVYSTTLRTEFGQRIPVEVSTTYLPDQQPPGYAFVLRDVSRLEASRQSGAALTSEAVEHVIELVGSTPLKELVRSTTDVVEKMCIETAIRLTGNNRAAAAEMLGLSRQSLYVKLRRFGLIDRED